MIWSSAVFLRKWGHIQYAHWLFCDTGAVVRRLFTRSIPTDFYGVLRRKQTDERHRKLCVFGKAAQDGDTLSASEFRPVCIQHDRRARQRRLGVTTDRMYRVVGDVISGVLCCRNSVETVLVCAIISNRHCIHVWSVIVIVCVLCAFCHVLINASQSVSQACSLINVNKTSQYSGLSRR